jgi:hypothetical protein
MAVQYRLIMLRVEQVQIDQLDVAGPLWRAGKAAGPAGRRRTMRTVRLNLT